MKKILVALSLLSIYSIANAQSTPSFCSGGQVSMNPDGESCITTCKAVASRPSSQLGANQSGFCIGQASKNMITVFEVALGRESSGNEPICKIWDGPVVVDRGGKMVGQSNQAGNKNSLSSCPSGIYDVVFVTVSRYEEFSGSTVFPDGSGKVVKTTGIFSNDNASVDGGINAWLETSTNHSDNSKGYVRPSSSWNNVYNKLAAAPSSVDLATGSEVTMKHDWWKQILISGSTDIRSGWVCEDGSPSLCDRIVGGNKIQMRFTSKNTAVSGLPILKNNERSLNKLDFSYYSSIRSSDNQQMGLKVLWRNDAGTLKYVGAYPGESGFMVTLGVPVGNEAPVR